MAAPGRPDASPRLPDVAQGACRPPRRAGRLACRSPVAARRPSSLPPPRPVSAESPCRPPTIPCHPPLMHRSVAGRPSLFSARHRHRRARSRRRHLADLTTVACRPPSMHRCAAGRPSPFGARHRCHRPRPAAAASRRGRVALARCRPPVEAQARRRLPTLSASDRRVPLRVSVTLVAACRRPAAAPRRHARTLPRRRATAPAAAPRRTLRLPLRLCLHRTLISRPS